MKRIKSAVEHEKIRRRNGILLGIAMIVLLVVSTGGYSIMSRIGDNNPNKINERGLSFVRSDGIWKMEIGNGVFSFRYLPSEVQNISVNLTTNLTTYAGKPLYFVNPSDGMGEILNNIGKYVLRYQEACLNNGNGTKCKGNLPVKNCYSNLIVFVPSNVTRVYERENCVFISGDLSKSSDAFLYKILGINHG